MIHTVTMGISTELGVTLLDSSNNPVNGVLFSAITVQYRKNGGVLTAKTVLAGEWTEVGDGVYKLSFTAAELGTAGLFRILVSGGTFTTYKSDTLIVDDYQTTAQQIIDIKADLALKVNIGDADTLFEQLEIRIRDAEDRVKNLNTRLQQALAAVSAAKNQP